MPRCQGLGSARSRVPHSAKRLSGIATLGGPGPTAPLGPIGPSVGSEALKLSRALRDPLLIGNQPPLRRASASGSPDRPGRFELAQQRQHSAVAGGGALGDRAGTETGVGVCEQTLELFGGQRLDRALLRGCFGSGSPTRFGRIGGRSVRRRSGELGRRVAAGRGAVLGWRLGRPGGTRCALPRRAGVGGRRDASERARSRRREASGIRRFRARCEQLQATPSRLAMRRSCSLRATARSLAGADGSLVIVTAPGAGGMLSGPHDDRTDRPGVGRPRAQPPRFSSEPQQRRDRPR